jgi:hypothetical protein
MLSSLGDEIVGRINQLAAISETPGRLTRVFLSREHRAAADLLLSWMRDAGMRAHLDAIGNVCGRYEGERPSLPCVMLGSHYDTVRDALFRRGANLFRLHARRGRGYRQRTGCDARSRAGLCRRGGRISRGRQSRRQHRVHCAFADAAGGACRMRCGGEGRRFADAGPALNSSRHVQ